MDAPFACIDRAVTLTFYPEDPVEVRLYLGDRLEEQFQRAVEHYDRPHTLEEDQENLASLVGRDTAEQLLGRAETRDRLTVVELLSYIILRCREEQGKKLMALAGG